MDKYKVTLEAAFKDQLIKNNKVTLSHLIGCGLLGVDNNSVDYLSIEEIIYLKLVVNLNSSLTA
ncbi:hypothetical protein PVK64_01480 [Aliivibrio sp. S4TY2]|uniref:hypothetical protein n=1 Tax=unclassified Aliivibrio TaxID=2645654 RepID=UPI0023788BC1|nr:MULTISPECIES: hypothetical protein [unclassified Aliivibrio]MDD9154862.1 hypothetical protein [Aliivibrio sp. S4TY2]MDD9158775.1 hypothetical protein [Aliivibrio sp. S4TY1]MDD9162865.1 hypothetical protein [Aliivibrio sp. S4MY2]MDD9166774.1 hypothetical protein [Aliivibrio sp. S4MY4]MDD9183942.1 hypothetical protein [Aliivibrio sp. S4MY3]